MDLINYLEKLDLTKKQAKVYLACLELGSAPANEIAKKSGLIRTTTYNILNELVEMHMINCLQSRSKKIYSADMPGKILDIWRSKHEKIKNQESFILQMIPYLNSVYNKSATKPRIRFYQGKQGIRSIMEESITDQPDTMYYINSTISLEDIIGSRYYISWIKRRIKAKIFAKGIRRKSQEVAKKLYTQTDPKHLREVRWIPKGIEIPMTFIIFNHKTGIISPQPQPFGFIVESLEFAKSIKSFFNLLWQVSQKE